MAATEKADPSRVSPEPNRDGGLASVSRTEEHAQMRGRTTMLKIALVAVAMLATVTTALAGPIGTLLWSWCRIRAQIHALLAQTASQGVQAKQQWAARHAHHLWPSATTPSELRADDVTRRRVSRPSARVRTKSFFVMAITSLAQPLR